MFLLILPDFMNQLWFRISSALGLCIGFGCSISFSISLALPEILLFVLNLHSMFFVKICFVSLASNGCLS